VRAILLYIETIRERRNFVAAARTAARNKPVLVVKAGQMAPSDRPRRSGQPASQKR
jgi:acetyltransferase